MSYVRSAKKAGWSVRAGGNTSLIPPEHGPEALGESNVLALASLITEPYYIGLRHSGDALRHDDPAP